MNNLITLAWNNNARMLYLKQADLKGRIELSKHPKVSIVLIVFYCFQQHKALTGKPFERFQVEDHCTNEVSKRLFHLPMWYVLFKDYQARVISTIEEVHI